MAQTILFHARELADLYALKTLHDYLKCQNLEAHLLFGGSVDTDRAREVLATIPTRAHLGAPIDLVVSAFSDIGGGMGGVNLLEIDISILKNCVPPLTEDEKQALKRKYNVTAPSPIVVIGFADGNSNLRRLVRALYPKAHLFLVGSTNFESLCLPEEAREKVHCITTWGVLKDYYAMADAAINAHNLEPRHAPLHNFIEATEGGPLFMVPPGTSNMYGQYGYRHLVTSGVIREVAHLEELISSVHAFIDTFQGNEECRERRREHLHHTRERYLPVIKACLLHRLGLAETPDTAGLVVEEGHNQVRLRHPDTDWGGGLIPIIPLVSSDKEASTIFDPDFIRELYTIITLKSPLESKLYHEEKVSPYEKEVRDGEELPRHKPHTYSDFFEPKGKEPTLYRQNEAPNSIKLITYTHENLQLENFLKKRHFNHPKPLYSLDPHQKG